MDGDYDKSLEDIVAKRKELDKYVDELHAMRDCGLSLYELINVYASNQSAPDSGAFDDGFADGITQERISIGILFIKNQSSFFFSRRINRIGVPVKSNVFRK